MLRGQQSAIVSGLVELLSVRYQRIALSALGCHRLPSPPSPSSSSFSSHVQNGLPENIGRFFEDRLTSWILSTRNVCEFPFPGVCRSSTSSSGKQQDERPGFFGIICLGSCIMALLASLGTLILVCGIPTCALLWAWADGHQCTLQ